MRTGTRLSLLLFFMESRLYIEFGFFSYYMGGFGCGCIQGYNFSFSWEATFTQALDFFILQKRF